MYQLQLSQSFCSVKVDVYFLGFYVEYIADNLYYVPFVNTVIYLFVWCLTIIALRNMLWCVHHPEY